MVPLSTVVPPSTIVPPGAIAVGDVSGMHGEVEEVSPDHSDDESDDANDIHIEVEQADSDGAGEEAEASEVASNPPSTEGLRVSGTKHSDTSSTSEDSDAESDLHHWWHPLVLLQKRTARPPPRQTVEDRIAILETKLSWFVDQYSEDNKTMKAHHAEFESGITQRLERLEGLLQVLVDKIV